MERTVVGFFFFNVVKLLCPSINLQNLLPPAFCFVGVSWSLLLFCILEFFIDIRGFHFRGLGSYTFLPLLYPSVKFIKTNTIIAGFF